MREIKFRSWDKEFNTMQYDIQNSSNQWVPEITTGVEYRQISDTEFEPYPVPELGQAPYTFEGFLKDPRFEVMQYIGIKDKNGKEIYESDILLINNQTKHVVTCYDYYFGLNDFWNTSFDNPHDAFSELHSSQMEVLGNIFDNQELLVKGE